MSASFFSCDTGTMRPAGAPSLIRFLNVTGAGQRAGRGWIPFRTLRQARWSVGKRNEDSGGAGVEDMVEWRRTGINDTDRCSGYRVRRLRFGSGVDLADIDAQAFVDIRLSVSLTHCMGHSVVRLVTGLAMGGELCRDESRKGFVVRAETRVSDGSDKKPRHGQNRVDPAPIPESSTYRWVGRLSHCGPLEFAA